MDWKTLLWWLGPWCNQEKSPRQIETTDFTVPNVDFRFRVYSGHNLLGAVLVLPGLHPDGLDDARMDRFCRVLAGAGAVVGVPELPTMMQSVMVPMLLQDVECAAEFFTTQLAQYGLKHFGVFCISASSIAGFALIANPLFVPRISRLHLFGGFADWMEALRFAMTGIIPGSNPEEKIVVDPLSLPVVYMNLMKSFPNFLPFTTVVQQQFFDCLHQYVSQSWEKPEVEHPNDTRRIADRLMNDWKAYTSEDSLDWGRIEKQFLQACALAEGGAEIVHQFLDGLKAQSLPKELDWLSVQNHLGNLETPIDISHGRDDFVVPYPQAMQLAQWIPPSLSRVFVTGLYHHTGVVSFNRLLQMLLGLPKEIWTSIQMVRAIAELPKFERQKIRSRSIDLEN